MLKIRNLAVMAVFAGMSCFGVVQPVTEQSVADAKDFAAVSSILPADGSFYRIINLRNFKYYVREAVAGIVRCMPEGFETEDAERTVTVLKNVWEFLGLGAIKVTGVADTEISAEKNVWETLAVAYSGQPLSGGIYDTFKGKFDTVKAAGSWPATTIMGCRFNLRITPVAKIVHENIEPLPLPAVEICKAVSGRYSMMIAEDSEGVLLDIIVPDNDAGFVFWSLNAALAEEKNVIAGQKKIIISRTAISETFPWDIVVFKHKNMIRICNGSDVPARIKVLPKLKDDPDFIALTEGIDPMGESVIYSGRKILAPEFNLNLMNGDISFEDIFVETQYETRSFNLFAFTDFGCVFKSRTFGSVVENNFEKIKFFLSDIENNWEMMKQGVDYADF